MDLVNNRMAYILKKIMVSLNDHTVYIPIKFVVEALIFNDYYQFHTKLLRN